MAETIPSLCLFCLSCLTHRQQTATDVLHQWYPPGWNHIHVASRDHLPMRNIFLSWTHQYVSEVIIPSKLNPSEAKLNLVTKILNLMNMKSNLQWACFFTSMSSRFIHIHYKRQLQCKGGLWESLYWVLCDTLYNCIILFIMAARRKSVLDGHPLARWQVDMYDMAVCTQFCVSFRVLRQQEIVNVRKNKDETEKIIDHILVVSNTKCFFNLIPWSVKTSWADGQYQITLTRSRKKQTNKKTRKKTNSRSTMGNKF